MDLISNLFITLLIYSCFSVILYTINRFFRTREGILFVHIPFFLLILSLYIFFSDRSLIHFINIGTQSALYPEFALSYFRLVLFTGIWLITLIFSLYPQKFKIDFAFYHWIFLTVIIFSASSATFIIGLILFILSFIPYFLSYYQAIHATFITRNVLLKQKIRNPEKVKISDRGEALIVLLFIIALASLIIIQILQVYL